MGMPKIEFKWKTLVIILTVLLATNVTAFFFGAVGTVPGAYKQGYDEGYVKALSEVKGILNEKGITFSWQDLGDGKYLLSVYKEGTLYARGNVEIHILVQKNDEVPDYHDGTLTEIGADFIEKQISGSASTTNAIYISCSADDGSLMSSASTQLTNEIDGNGFTRNTGVYANTGTGTWNVSYTFSATGTQTVQLYGLQWNATKLTDENLLCYDTSAPKNCEIGDTLKATWQCTVSQAA